MVDDYGTDPQTGETIKTGSHQEPPQSEIDAAAKLVEETEKKSLFVFKIDYKIEWKGSSRRAKMKFKISLTFAIISFIILHEIST